MNNANNVAAKMTTPELHHVAATLETELRQDFAACVRGTQAHMGKIELLTACSAELARRGGLGF